MLPRVLEPEVMDTAEEARDYDAMDHAEVNRAFVSDFLAVWNGQGTVLDVGTGTALIPIELCLRHAEVRIVGIDLAEEMLKLGRANVRRAGLEERIRLERCDAKQLLYPSDTFGAVISNSIIHHIPRPEQTLAEMVRAVRPGGSIFVRDLFRPNDEATLRHLIKTYAGDANADQQQLFADSLRAALTVEEVREMIKAIHCDPEGVRQTSDRHWTWTTKLSEPEA